MSTSGRTILSYRNRGAPLLTVLLLAGGFRCTGNPGNAADVVETASETPPSEVLDGGLPDPENSEGSPIEEAEVGAERGGSLPDGVPEDADVGGADPEREPTALDDGVQEAETSLGEPCYAGFTGCRNGVRYSCGPSGVLVADPCPAGMVCLDGDCVDNVTRIYIVVDNDSLRYKFLVDHEIMELALSEAQDRGSICPEDATYPFPPPFDSYVVTGWMHMRTQLLAAFLLRRLLDSFLKDPHVQIVIIHSPYRTTIQETQNDETLCAVGYHEPVSLPAATGFAFPCEFSPFSESELEQVFPFMVYGYPNPWSLSPARTLEFADGVETVRDTGVPCTSSEECGTGGCYLGSCFEHENDEIRSNRLPDPIEFNSPGGGQAFCDINLLYLAAEFIRRHGTSAGRPCATDEDCYPKPAYCGSENICLDEAASCVRNHVAYLAGPCYNGDFLINVTKWMRNRLYCEDDSCAGDACLAPPTDDPQFPCYFGSSNAAEMCIPNVPGYTGSSEDPPVVQIVADVSRGWRSPPMSQGRFQTLGGQPLEATTHMVFAGGYSPYDLYYAGYPLIVSLGNAIAGGGRWVIPGNGELPLSSDLYGPFAAHWSNQLEEFIQFVQADRANFVCAP